MTLEHRVTPALRERIRARPAYRAFAALLGERIQRGNQTDAFRMLEDIGAPGAIANQIIEGWPRRGAPHELEQAGMVHGEIAACWLACHVDDIGNYDWTALLIRSCGAARRKRTRDHLKDSGLDQVAEDGDPKGDA